MQTASAGTGLVPATAAEQTPPAKHWSLVKSSGICPTARSGHSAVVANESLYIFGGCGHPALKRGSELAGSDAVSSSPAEDEDLVEAMPVCLGDLNVYDLARQRWSEVGLPPAAGANAGVVVLPAERTCAAMCASEEEDRLFLSGGAGDDPYDLRADLLEFDVRRRSWRLLYDGGAGGDVVGGGGSVSEGSGSAAGAAAAAGASACRRIGHAMVHDAERNRLVVFGGSTGEFSFRCCSLNQTLFTAAAAVAAAAAAAAAVCRCVLSAACCALLAVALCTYMHTRCSSSIFVPVSNVLRNCRKMYVAV